MLRGGGVQPQTAGNDLAHLGAVLSVARPAWGCDVDPHAMADARKVLAKLGYKLKSRERDRRPSLKELDLIFGEFEKVLASRPTSINMLRVSGFAIFSTRRQDEICRIRWDDLDESRQAVMVRDMKNPGDNYPDAGGRGRGIVVLGVSNGSFLRAEEMAAVERINTNIGRNGY